MGYIAAGPLAPDFSPESTTARYRNREATPPKSIPQKCTARCQARKRETGCEQDPRCDFGIVALAMSAAPRCWSHLTEITPIAIFS